MEEKFEKLKELADKEYDELVKKLKNAVGLDWIHLYHYEFTVKNELAEMLYHWEEPTDIMISMMENNVQRPLEFLYQEWLKADGGIHQPLEEFLINSR